MCDKQNKTVQAHCPNCDGERNCDLHARVPKAWDWSDRHGNSMNGADDHSLLECRGCGTVFYEKASWNSENMDYWYDSDGKTCGEPVVEKTVYPKPDSRRKPEWFYGIAKKDSQLANILSEMYVAYDNQSYILTAVGLRTALDRSTEILGIDAAITFDEKLSELKNGGWIGDTEKEVLGVVTDAGNAAAHRGWEPTTKEVDQLLSAMEVFLQRAFIVGKEALKIAQKIPPQAEA